MSGPKVTQIRETAQERRRQRDILTCQRHLARISHLRETLSSANANLARLGLAAVDDSRARAMAESAGQSLDQGRHADAVAQAAKASAAMGKLVRKATALLDKETALIRDRSREAAELAAQIHNRLAELRATSEAGHPPELSREIQNLATLKQPGSALSREGREATESYIHKAMEALQNVDRLAAEAANQVRIAEKRGEAGELLRRAKEKRHTAASPASEAMIADLTAGLSSGPGLEEAREAAATAREAALRKDRQRFLDEARRSLDTACAILPVNDQETLLARHDELLRENDNERLGILAGQFSRSCSQRISDYRDLQRFREAAATLLEEFAGRGGEATAKLLAKLETARTSGEAIDLEKFRADLEALATREERLAAHEAKRRAIIHALRELGYEAEEGLQTAFVRQGKVILRQANRAEDYAVEMTADANLENLQTCLVRLEDAQSSAAEEELRQRDIERETEWCQDHRQLREYLARNGFETNFRMQLAPGEHPVRVVSRAGNANSQVSRRARQSETTRKHTPDA